MTHRTNVPHDTRRSTREARRLRACLPDELPHTCLRGGDSAERSGVGHAGRPRLTLALGLACAFLALALALVARPQRAWASTVTFANGATATLDDDTGKIHGRSHVVFYYTEGMGATFFKVSLPDGQTIVGHCISYGHYVPADGTYSFTGTPNGDGSYDVIAWGSEATDYHPISASIDIWPAQNVGGITWTPRLAGWIELSKASGTPELTRSNDAYSLEGATYGVYSDFACTVEVGRMTTGADGKAKSDPLASGTYYVCEITPSPGYALDTEAYAAAVTGGTGCELAVVEWPAYATPSLLLRKLDADTSTAVPQGSASLSGAMYTVSHYSGFRTLDDLPTSPLHTWTFKTDADGRIPFDAAHLVSGTLLTNHADTACLPLGTYVIEEATPSTGYRTSSPTRHLVQVTQDGLVERTHTYAAPTDAERVIRGGVVVRKRDAESHGPSPLGSGSFEGITFQVVNRSSRSVMVDGSSHAPGAACMTITTDAEGVARTAADALPYGRYEIRETGHGRGYFGNTGWSQTFEVTRQGELVNLRAAGTAVEDQIRRGDISLTKHDGETGEIMAGVPFLLTSNTTGEAHVVVTDENGMLSTSSSWNRHSSSTNANDGALTANADGSYTVDESRLDPEAGVWFGLATLDDDSQSITEANDHLGALPYDRVADGGGYTLRELPCAANEGHRMVEATFSVTRDGIELGLGTFDDNPVRLSTTLTASDGAHVSAADAQVTLTDVVRYEGLAAGSAYTISGELHAFAADGSDLGVVATSSTSVTPTSGDGTAELTFSLDASGLGGQRVVAYETLSLGGVTWATHTDPDDEDQTVYFPSIATVAHGLETQGDDAAAMADAGITDTVSYAGLQPGEGYELQASLHLLATDGSDGGEVAIGSESFDAESAEGSASVTLEGVDLSPYAGRDLVVFERLVRGGQTWATHEDLASRSQTVHVPSIRTSAAPAHAEGVITASSGESIVDTVTYENLLPETDYLLQASVHLVGEGEDGPVDGGLLANAEPVSFTTPAAEEGADTVSGTVEVPIEVDLSGLDGRGVVVFETLLRGDVTLATHADPSDEGQTVRVPAIHTTATHEGDHDALAAEGRTILDEVRYENLVPGLTYLMTGSLMGLPTGGEEVVPLGTSSLEFTPKEANGSVVLRFEEVDLSDLAGGRAVAYEVLGYGELVVATHQDPHDEDQTIHVPRIHTEALGSSGTHTAFAGSDQTITDTVTYEGLLPGRTYTATATLHAVSLGIDGEPRDDGSISDPSVVTFITPAAEEGEDVVSGSVEVQVHAYLSDLAGANVVCFEELSREDVVVATHEDPADEGQTVHLPRLATSANASRPNDEGVVAIVDTVTYENLVPGETYEVVGTIHRKGPANEDLGVVSIEEGTPLTARTSFEAQKASGSVEVAFEVDVPALGLTGGSVVVFEELRQDDVIVARHNEIASVDQLVVFDAEGVPASRGPIPQTGWEELPYLLAAVLAFVSLGSGVIAARRYNW